MNRNRIITIILVLLASVCTSNAVAGVVASVDRTSLVVDETLTLTITRDSSSFFTDPDLEPLQKDFKVLGQSQQSSTQIINGSASSTVSWRVTLAPRRAGTLEIPPLAVGKEKTAAIAVQVSAEAQPKTRGDNVPIFIETDVDEQTVYVQSQVIYTLRIYWAADIQIIDPEGPNVADALTEKLEDTTFEKVIDGRAYKVFERKYAIFPQKSGVMEIPQMVVQVNVPARNSRQNFFDPFGRRGETLKLRSEGEKVTVKEKPQEYPASAVWLPSAGLVIKDEWSKDPRDLKVGESATLSLSITADGLMAEQLPPVELVEPEGVKLYQGKADVDNMAGPMGIIGKRKESIALIPTRTGEMEIPEIRIPWWDKGKEKVDYAVIPARRLSVQGTARHSQAEGSPDDSAKTNNEPAVSAPTVVQPPLLKSSPTVLIILCALFAAAWLATLCLLLSTRRQVRELGRIQEKESENERAVNEQKAFHSLVNACRANDPEKVRESILSWARAFWPQEKMQTFADINRTVHGSELMPLLREIDYALYGQGKVLDQWQGAELLKEVEKVRKEREQKKKHKEGLQKLYK